MFNIYILQYLYFLQYQNTDFKINSQKKKHKSISLNSTHVAGLDPAGLVGSLVQISDPAGQTRGTREFPSLVHAQLLFKWIIIHLNGKTWMKLHAQRWGEQTWRRKQRRCRRRAGWFVSVFVCFSSSPLFSVSVRLLSLSLCLRPSLSLLVF